MKRCTTAVLFGVKTSRSGIYDDEEYEGPADIWNNNTDSESEQLYTSDYDPDCHGFVVAIGNDSIDGVLDFSAVMPVPLDEFSRTEPFARSIERARGLWDRFRSRVKVLAPGVLLPEGRLYLTTIEVF